MGSIVSFNVYVPSSWEEMTDEQRRYVWFLMAEGYDTEAITVFCMLRWAGIRVLARQGTRRYLVAQGKAAGVVGAAEVAAAAKGLSFLGELPSYPCCPECIGGHKALPADFVGVPLERFLCVENLFQGYLATKDAALLQQMAEVMYDAPGIRLSAAEEVGVFWWMASLKQLLQRRFTYFLRPAGEGQGGGESEDIGALGMRLQESMDAQIRALTKGDVTKEAEVLQLDTWRALTELNAQAKEYEDIRRNSK